MQGFFGPENMRPCPADGTLAFGLTVHSGSSSTSSSSTNTLCDTLKPSALSPTPRDGLADITLQMQNLLLAPPQPQQKAFVPSPEPTPEMLEALFGTRARTPPVVLPPASQAAARRMLLGPPDEDIDAGDAGEPIFCSAFVEEVYDGLRAREAADAVDPDYLERVQTPGSGVTARTRALLVNWMMEVCLKFKLASETLYLSVGLVDRYLARRAARRDTLQLLGITAMFVAAKFEEIYPPLLDDFVYISADTYTADEIIVCERDLLAAVQWNLTAPFSLLFLRRFSKACGCDALLHTMGKYLLEHALLSAAVLRYAPSLQAAAAVYLARVLLGVRGPAWPRTVRHYSAYTEAEVLPCAQTLATLLTTSDPKLRFVVQKYSSPKLGSVARTASLSAVAATEVLKQRLLAIQ